MAEMRNVVSEAGEVAIRIDIDTSKVWLSQLGQVVMTDKNISSQGRFSPHLSHVIIHPNRRRRGLVFVERDDGGVAMVKRSIGINDGRWAIMCVAVKTLLDRPRCASNFINTTILSKQNKQTICRRRTVFLTVSIFANRSLYIRSRWRREQVNPQKLVAMIALPQTPHP